MKLISENRDQYRIQNFESNFDKKKELLKSF